jgi:outer membrane lipopolysaccharide assembly protein LptE/RlpB
MDSETTSCINCEKSHSYSSTPVKRRKNHEDDSNEGLEQTNSAKQVRSSVCLEIPQVFEHRDLSMNSSSLPWHSDQPVSIASSDTAAISASPAAESQPDNTILAKNQEGEMIAGLEQTNTLASIVDEFLSLAAAAPQSSSAHDICGSVCLEIPQVFEHRDLSMNSSSLPWLSDQPVSIASSDTAAISASPAAESQPDNTILAKNQEGEMIAGLEQTNTLASIVDEFLSLAAAAPQSSSAHDICGSVCLEIPQVFEHRDLSMNSSSLPWLSDQPVSIASSDTAAISASPAAESQPDNTILAKNQEGEMIAGLEQTNTLASIVDEFLSLAAAAPQSSSAHDICGSVCLEIPQVFEHRDLSMNSSSLPWLSDQPVSITSSDTAAISASPAAESQSNVTSSHKSNRKNLHAIPSKTSENRQFDRAQAQQCLAGFSNHDVGAMAAVKDMIGLAVAGDSFRMVFELFLGAIDLGIHLDISFICRDLLKMVLSTNQTEKMLLFFYAVIEIEQNVWQPHYHAHFRNLCGGKAVSG